MVEDKNSSKKSSSTAARTRADKASAVKNLEVKNESIDNVKESQEKLVIKINISKSKIPLIVLFVVLLGALYYFKSLFLVAVVNGEPIYRYAIVQELEKQSGQQVTGALVTKMLILQEAKKKNINVAEKEINDEIKKIEDNLSKQGQKIDAVLTEQGITKKDLRERIQIQKIVEKLFAKDIKVTDKETKEYFDKNESLFGEDAEYEKVKDTIAQQLQQIKLNEKFQNWITELQKQAKIEYFVSY
ncbi:hypothetical protein C4577_07165 [Candidatus Parcubacteria bacterium]|nr:MAG: hypothetical protein C4577_07165 [Candidatus Parcubacteria bacterium]